ncbi:MAG: hypothetical protein KIT48_04775 [Pseudolabrys sp.]|nr:hypothetical protein [Pseudolabrys sp.]
MSHRKKLILWPGFGALLGWFFEPELGIGLAMILLVLLTAYIPAAHAERPLRSPTIIALGAFLIWFAALWLIVLAAMPFRTGLVSWVSATPTLASSKAALSAIVVLYALAGLAAGAVQILVLRYNAIPVRASYSLIGLAAGFAILGWSFVWHQATGNDTTIMLPAFLSGLPALILLEGRRQAPTERFPMRATLSGETVDTGVSAAVSAAIATAIAGLAFGQSALSISDLNPLGSRGTASLSLALLWLLTFTTAMGFALLYRTVRIHRTALVAAGRPPAVAASQIADTDGWSMTAILMATGLLGMSALLLGVSALEVIGYRVTDLIPHQLLIGMLVALFMTARGTFGALLDFVFVGMVAWGIYGLYAIMTLDPINEWVSHIVTVLVPG